MTSDNDERSELFGIDRRNFLGAATAGALGLAATGQGAAQESGDGAENSRFAVSEHDHSGEHGASDRLGVDAPVKSIEVEDLVTENTPVVDVRAYGVVGDGETDDAAALQDAIDAATPHGVLHIPADLKVRLESGVTANLNEGRESGEQNRFAFLCEGAITPAPGIGHAVTIAGGMAPYVFARVQGGGEDVETDSAFYVHGSRGGLFEGWGRNYDGRIFHFEASATYSIGHLKAWNCGQSIAVFNASPMGEMRDVFDIGPTRAPEFHGSSDICINQYENFVDEDSEKGMVFDQCVSIWVDKIAVGGPMSAPQIEFHETINIHANSIFVNDGEDDGLVTDRIRRANMRVFARNNEVGMRHVVGGSIGANSIHLTARINEAEGLLVEPHEGGTSPDSYHQFSGYVTNNGAPARIETADPHVRVHNLLSKFNDEPTVDQLVVPDEENNVRVEDCWIQGIDGSPKAINHLGREAREADVPNSLNWDVGDHVHFTDTDDGSGDGLYLLADDDQWLKYGDVEPIAAENTRPELLVHQGDDNNVPEDAFDQSTQGYTAVADTIGQSFIVDQDFTEIDVKLANWGNDASAATMTLYEGSPADGDLTEIESRRVDSVPNNQQVTLDFDGESAGTYYLEMDEPTETPTWWWHEGDDVEDVGGQAFVDRKPVPEADLGRDVSQANFTIRVLG